jgi:tetratricopeptide (TPR) repeat protein
VSSTTYNELAKIDQTCIDSSSQCLLEVETALLTSLNESRQWYRLKLLKLDALFNLQKVDQLSTEINALLTLKTRPINFSVYVYIYHAKILNSIKDNTLAKKYIEKAINLLKQINDKYPDPMRLIEIANIQLSMKEYTLAKSTLLQLEQKFEGKYHPIFKRELYANLGHIAVFQKDHALHVTYREKSLKWALSVNNNQQIGIAYYNLARAYSSANRYELAQESYENSITYATIEKDTIIAYTSQLRLVELFLLQGESDKAFKLFNQLPALSVDNKLSVYFKALHHELKLKLPSQ